MAGSFALGPDGVVGVGVSGLREKLRVFVIGDTHLGLFTCGNPAWGAATDPYWEIERRERWAERQSPETFEFSEAVLSTPNLVAVFSGHDHQTMVATERGKLMLSVPWNANGAHFDVTLRPLA